MLGSAGFFDGEGWSNKDKDGYPRIAITQCDPGVLERFKDSVEIGTISGPYSNSKNPNANPQWSYSAWGNEAIEAMDKLIPYLSPVKTEQWKATLENARLPRKKGFCGRSLHEMVPGNVMKDTSCRACQNERARKYHRQRKERLNVKPL